MFDFFLWNLPLFVDSKVLKAKLECAFPRTIVDIFGPSKSNHRSHGGCARILSEKDFAFGEQTPIDLGFRFPIYGKLSSPRKRRVLHKRPAYVRKLSIASYDSPWIKRSFDEVSDEKSCGSVLSISCCGSVNIVDFSIVSGEGIDILPRPGVDSWDCLKCDVVPGIDLNPVTVTDCAGVDVVPLVPTLDGSYSVIDPVLSSIYDLDVMTDIVSLFLSCIYEDEHESLNVNHTIDWIKREFRNLSKEVFDGWMKDFSYDLDTGSFSWRGSSYDEPTRKWSNISYISPS